MKTLSTFLLLFLAAGAQAQGLNADLSVLVQVTANPAHPGSNLTWSIIVFGNGPSTAQDVVVTVDLPGDIVNIPPWELQCTSGHPMRCTVPGVGSSSNATAQIAAKAPATPGTYNVTATVSSSTHDPNPDNNTITLPFVVSDAADASVFFPNQGRFLPGQPRTVKVGVGTGSRVLHDVRLSLEATGTTIGSITPPAGFTCTGGVCTASVFGPQSSGIFLVQFVGPDRDDVGGTVYFDAVVTSSDPDFNPDNNHASIAVTLVSQFAVTSTADSGPGSLRQAMIDANRAGFSAPAQIAFRLPNPSVIQPLSPLPPLGGIVTLDATDKGIEIRGDLLQEGHGITLEDICEVRLRGLTISGFPHNGINIGSARVCGGEYPPVVISGNKIRGNERGIGGSQTNALSIAGNVIGGNRRSGIFLYDGGAADIGGNFIGVTADGTPEPNGASGIYVNIGSASIRGNVIANNGEFGIAVHPAAPAVGMRENLIFANGQTSIDVGLDLESPNGNDGQRPPLNHPVLTDARYDAATKKTIVRGRYDTQRDNGDVVLELFSSATLNAKGHAEAQHFLGRLKIFTSRDFEFTTDGDLTGQFITATATIEDYLSFSRDVTSELSAPVQVKP